MPTLNGRTDRSMHARVDCALFNAKKGVPRYRYYPFCIAEDATIDDDFREVMTLGVAFVNASNEAVVFIEEQDDYVKLNQLDPI